MNAQGHRLAISGTCMLLIILSSLLCADGKSTAISGPCHYDASNGDCSFYHCLDVKLSTSRQTFQQQVAHKFCRRMREHFDEFTPEGQDWADSTNICVMRQLSVETDTMDTCHDVGGLVQRAFHACAAKKGICNVLWDNRQALFNTMTQRSWLSIVQSARHCPRRVVNRYIFWTLANLNV